MSDKPVSAFRDHPLFVTQRAALALAARYRKALRDKGIDDLNLAQLSILAEVEAHDGTTATAVARAVMYEKSTMTPLLDKLETAGHILRARDPKDGRVQRLFITKKGRKRRRDAEVALTEATAVALDPISRKVMKHHLEFCEAILALEGEAVATEVPESTPAKASTHR
jgi:DNA-binding MarR family transcriptional regulator